MDSVEFEEPDAGMDRTEVVCFMLDIRFPRRREAVFTFTLSNSSTAILGEDFDAPYIFNITIPDMIYSRYDLNNRMPFCVDVTIIGDDDMEADKTIVYYVVAEEEEDSVVFRNGTDNFEITIRDNDGKQ